MHNWVCVCVCKFQFPGAKLIYDTIPNKLFTALFLIVKPEDGYFQVHIVQKYTKTRNPIAFMKLEIHILHPNLCATTPIYLVNIKTHFK